MKARLEGVLCLGGSVFEAVEAEGGVRMDIESFFACPSFTIFGTEVNGLAFD